MDWQAKREHPGYFETKHAAALFQVHEPTGGKPSHATWVVNRTWEPVYTDLCLLQVSADGGAATHLQTKMPTAFFEWPLLSPPMGAQVTMLQCASGGVQVDHAIAFC